MLFACPILPQFFPHECIQVKKRATNGIERSAEKKIILTLTREPSKMSTNDGDVPFDFRVVPFNSHSPSLSTFELYESHLATGRNHLCKC